MNSCASCGRPIPDGQRVCSMCYGDPEYGRDGYYRDWLEEKRREEEEEEERIAEQMRQEQERSAE